MKYMVTYCTHIMDYVDVLFVKISTKAITPTRASKYSAGLDLYSPCNHVIPPFGHLQISTQLKIKIPLGHYGRLASKSSLAMLHQVHVRVGVIDPDYTGEIKILLINASPHVYRVKKEPLSPN